MIGNKFIHYCRESAQISPMEHLKQLAHTHSPHISTDWMSAPLLGQDADFKAKVRRVERTSHTCFIWVT